MNVLFSKEPYRVRFAYIDIQFSEGDVVIREKQRTQRAYDFTGVSDEFKRVISSLRGHDDKIRVVLNKADQVDTQQLMRVYGALMWSLGKVLNTPEVMRVYIGSFNDKPVSEAIVGPIGKELFDREQEDLSDLNDIPKKHCDRREGSSSDPETDDGAGTSRKLQKRARGKFQLGDTDLLNSHLPVHSNSQPVGVIK